MSRGSEPGYRPVPKLYKIRFDDHPGLVVRAKTVSTDVFLRVTRHADDPDLTPETCEELFSDFADVLVSWNLEYYEDGPIDKDTQKPRWLAGAAVPTTLAGLQSQEFDLVMAIILGWMSAVAGVAGPLAEPSTSGLPSQVESLPMDVLSPSLMSSSGPS